jgi:zinc protease
VLDRTQAPQPQEIRGLALPTIEKATLDCGIDVFYLIEKNTDAFKIEVVHQGGFMKLQSAGESVLLCKMLLEGTLQHKGHDFMNAIDHLGSFIESSPGFDHANISLFGLKRYFSENVALLCSAIYHASFEADRLSFLKDKELNRLKLNREKGSYLTSINLRKNLFGEHPYGYTLDPADIANVQLDILKEKSIHHIRSFDLFVAGDLPEDFIEVLNSSFKQPKAEIQPLNKHQWPRQYASTDVRKEKYLQSSIRLGQRLFSRDHQDYAKFMVLNELFGGFFGSRLMKNIREEKGYTYGISSHLYALEETGYFTIGTEVNAEAEEDTLIQIQLEMDRLKSELVSTSELNTVKNYMLGSFTNSFSAPFAPIDKFKALHGQGLDLSFYQQYLNQIKEVSAEDLMQTANAYFDFDVLSRSIVGKP